MRFSLAILFAPSLVSGYAVLKRQTTDPVPACALKCSTTVSTSPCVGDDVACMCLNPNYTGPLTTCVQQTCTPAEVAQAAQAADDSCKNAGVDPENPVPACALSCSQVPATQCPSTDRACACKDTNYVTQLYNCVRNSCTGQDLTTAELVGEASCRAVGVDITSSVGA